MVTNVCFHGIGIPDRVLEPDEDAYWVSRDAYHRILDELAKYPEVQLSFDDGNASDVEIALPALLERGLTATFFVLAGRLEHQGSLAGDQVRELRSAGMLVGSHGMKHRSWRAMSAPESRVELVEARSVLTEVTGQRVVDAALPMGKYDRRLLADLRRHGYRHVYTSDRDRTSEHAWLQPRYTVVSRDTAESLRSDVLTAPGWAYRTERRVARAIKRLR